MTISTLFILCVALPALADSRLQVRRMTRDDVPLGKGQCDIRLQVDNQVEVSVRGDMVFARTLSGQDARDDGSECKAPLPNRDVEGFNFEVKDSRGDIRLLAAPSRRNDFAAVVAIRAGSGGVGGDPFRVRGGGAFALPLVGGGGGRPGKEGREPGFDPPPSYDRPGGFDRPPSGFVWNNTINFRGQGRGVAGWAQRGALRPF